MSSSEALKARLPTIHHLNDSQSQRILWLLEELPLEYNVVLYVREPKAHRAPPSLAEISPLGKSPVLVTSDGRTITESSAIAAYLIKTYDTNNLFAAQDWIKDEQLTSFSGASIGTVNTLELLFDLAAKHAPFPFSFLLKKVRKSFQDNFTNVEFKKDLTWLTEQLGGKQWFNGDHPGRSDIMLSWPFDMISARHWIDLEKEYPELAAWSKRIKERPAWKSGVEKGNGYNLSQW